MNNKFSTRAAISSAAGSLSLLATASGAAHADLTVMTDTTITGLPAGAVAAAKMPDMSKPTSATSYYKGDKIRTEAAGAVTIITGGTASQLVTLNPAMKTYYALPLTSEAAGNPFAAMLSITAAGGNVRKTAEVKTLLSKNAAKYDLYIPMKVALNGASTELMKINVTGAEWTTDAVALPTGAASPTSQLSKAMMGPMAGVVKELTKQMSEVKGFPLLTVMSWTFVVPSDSPLAAMGSDMIPSKVDMKSEVKSLSEAPLSDDLFAIPADYKKVDPPAPPQLPGVGGDAPSAAPPASAAPSA